MSWVRGHFDPPATPDGTAMPQSAQLVATVAMAALVAGFVVYAAREIVRRRSLSRRGVSLSPCTATDFNSRPRDRYGPPQRDFPLSSRETANDANCGCFTSSCRLLSRVDTCIRCKRRWPPLHAGKHLGASAKHTGAG
jgi:hypothetical protein